MTRIVKGLFGGKSSSEGILQRFRPVGFQSPGATGSFDAGSNTYSLLRTPERSAAISSVVSGFNAQSQAMAGLRPQVAPGFGRLTRGIQASTQERIAALRGEGRRTVGNIRENLARRRLAGSSFQASEVAAAEAEFARAEDTARAESAVAEAQAFISEIGLTSDLIKEEFGAAVAGAETVLRELNFDTSTVASLAGLSSQLINDNLTAQAEARAAQEAAGEDFLGTMLGIFMPTKKKGT